MEGFGLGLEDLPLQALRDALVKDRETLTFGVEIKGAFATLDDCKADPHPDDPRNVLGITGREHNFMGIISSAYAHVRKTLSEAGMLCQTSRSGLPFDWSPVENNLWVVKGDGSILPPDGPTRQTDEEVKQTPFWFVGIEINSPAYRFSPDTLDNVKKTCEVLRNTYRISCNRSCGLHVHVGNGDKGLSFRMTRNLYATLWEFEPQILEIHPFHRHENPYVRQFRVDSQMAVNLKKCNMNQPKIGLNYLLYWTHSFTELGGRVMAAPNIAKMAYNTSNLLDGMEEFHVADCKKTIEFRQHKSTLDPPRVMNWIRFCVGIVEFAGAVDDKVLAEFLQRHIDHTPGEFSIGKVLTALDMPDISNYYKNNVIWQREKDRLQLLKERKAEDEEEPGARLIPTSSSPSIFEAPL
ncbi:hypothetical protein G7Y89_g10459 [Cudoniella acicularis]|uniref:Amidoligase enzyme n=1 Tax=Cudoniella acicularis TaxID=354080 RepID=A0A8H4RFH5_9HELO|nr:hypothetical protein G7Y89_g10459 [Cudoniella acicularis]